MALHAGRRIAASGYAVWYGEDSWWACDADGVLTSRHMLRAADCWALVDAGALIAHARYASVVIYRMVKP